MKGKRILIVEDEFVTGELLRSWIVGAGGVPVGPAFTGRSAVELIARDLPNAALLDVSLLDGSSVQVARDLQARGVPYAILTGHSLRSLPVELRSAPYLEKPVIPEELKAMLGRLLKR